MQSQQPVFPLQNKGKLPKPIKSKEVEHFYKGKIDDPAGIFRIVAFVLTFAALMAGIFVAASFDNLKTETPPTTRVEQKPLYNKAPSSEEFMTRMNGFLEYPKLSSSIEGISRTDNEMELEMNSIVAGQLIVAGDKTQEKTHILEIDNSSIQMVATIEGSGRSIITPSLLILTKPDSIRAYDITDRSNPEIVWEKEFENATVRSISRGSSKLEAIISLPIDQIEECPIIVPLKDSTITIDCTNIWYPTDYLYADTIIGRIDISTEDGGITMKDAFIGTKELYTLDNSNIIATVHEAEAAEILKNFATWQAAGLSPDVITKISSFSIDQYEEMINTIEEDLSKEVFSQRFSEYVSITNPTLHTTHLLRFTRTPEELESTSISGAPYSRESITFYEEGVAVITDKKAYHHFDTNLTKTSETSTLGSSKLTSARIGSGKVSLTFERPEESAVLYAIEEGTLVPEVSYVRSGLDSFILPLSGDRFMGFEEKDTKTLLSLIQRSAGQYQRITTYDLREDWQVIRDSQRRITYDALERTLFIPGNASSYIIGVGNETISNLRSLPPREIRDVIIANDFALLISEDRVELLNKDTWELSDTFLFTPPEPVITESTTEIVAPQVQSGTPGAGYNRFTIGTEVGSFLVDVVTIDMAGVRMLTDTASDNDCSDNCPTIPLSEYVSRNGAFAGINGTYFCPTDYASCAGKTNSFDFPVYNSRLSKWINAGNLFWNDRSMVYQDGGGMRFIRNANSFGGGLNAGIVNHPGVLENGTVISDQFPLTDVQRNKGTKGGIGFSGNKLYLVIARNVSMTDLGYVFKSLGAESALNLDGGGSVALWYNGYKVGPGRNLPNAVVFAR